LDRGKEKGGIAHHRKKQFSSFFLGYTSLLAKTKFWGILFTMSIATIKMTHVLS